MRVIHDSASYRPDIDGLRAIAVLAVIGFHSGLYGFSGGFVGVDVFFVISGFLISSIIFKALQEQRFSLADFYARRIRRIFPALILVLLTVWAFGYLKLLPREFKELGTEIEGGAGFLANIVFWKQMGYFQGAVALKPLVHLWSLGIEEQFYLLWPATVLVLWKTRFRLPLMLFLLAASFSMNVAGMGREPEAVFYLPQTRLWELLIGCCLAYVDLIVRGQVGEDGRRYRFLRDWCSFLRSKESLRNAMAFMGLALIGVAIVVFNGSTPFPGFAALVPTLGTALVIAGGSRAWPNRIILSARALVFVGLISYPLYLWHWPLLFAVRVTTRNHPSATVIAISVLCAFLLSWATYLFVELPVRTTSLPNRRRAVVWALVAGMIVACCLGLVSVRTDGLPQRLPPEYRGITELVGEYPSLWRSGDCFLADMKDGRVSFGEQCLDVAPKGAPLVFLWGDSHAAALYPGIRKLQSSGSRFRMAQFTAAACPPVLDFDFPRRANCRGINNYVLGKITESRPDTVILAAEAWPMGDASYRPKMLQTITAVKQAGARRVIVVGPSPHWKCPLSVLLVGQCKVLSKCPFPERWPKSDLYKGLADDDHTSAAFFSESGVTYLSALDLFCNETGCMTRVQDVGRSELTTFDWYHLNVLASEYLASQLLTSLNDSDNRAAIPNGRAANYPAGP